MGRVTYKEGFKWSTQARSKNRSRGKTGDRRDTTVCPRFSRRGVSMHIFIAILSFVILLGILWDAFETVILPRSVTRSFRLARFYYRNAWRISTALARKIPSAKWRDAYLGYYGPLSLLGLF